MLTPTPAVTPGERLAARLEADATALAHRACEHMYDDPFWEERYGARGRRFSEEDGVFHVRYLVEALRVDAPSIFTGYARWLQRLLLPRGMCSLHVAQNFARLRDAIIERGVADAHRAAAILDEGARALVHDVPAARCLDEHAARLSARAAALCNAPAPELAVLVSYLTDAVGLATPRLFVDHLLFHQRFLAKRGVSRDGVIARLDAMRTALREEAHEARAVAEPVLAEARAAILAVPDAPASKPALR